MTSIGENEKSLRKHFAAIIRHGEHDDGSNQSYEYLEAPNKSDPPLTPLGMNQASKTGKYLNTFFKNNYNFDKVIIECSPSLRCMITASQIASQLDYLYVGSGRITINYRAY